MVNEGFALTSQTRVKEGTERETAGWRNEHSEDRRAWPRGGEGSGDLVRERFGPLDRLQAVPVYRGGSN